MKGIYSIIFSSTLLVALLGCGSSSSSSSKDFDRALEAARSEDFESALSIWLPLAEAGDAASQFHVGYIYSNGLGVPTNYAEARKWYELSAQQDNTEAQYYLAGLYFEGRGVEMNPATAERWLRKAAIRGHSSAQNNLGVLYAKRSNSDEDNFLSIRWQLRAAKKGNSTAQYNIGSRYLLSAGTKENAVEALAWLRLSANQRDPDALNNMGAIFSQGRTGLKHPILAYVLYKLSNMLGPSQNATNNLAKHIQQLSPEQIEKAETFLQSIRERSDLITAIDEYMD